MVGLWLLFVATNPGRNETIDSDMRQTVARQLWTTGSVAVHSIPPDSQGYPWVPAGPGRWVAPYGVGQSLVFVPFDMIAAAMERVAPASWRERVGWLPIGFILLPLLGLALWATMRALLREWGLPDPWPVAGASLMMLATLLFHYAGDPQEETQVSLLLALAMLFALRLRRTPTWRLAMLAGLCVGGAFVTRTVAIFAVLIVPVLVLSAVREPRARVRLLAVMGVAAAAIASISFWYNYARFGSPFTVGYDRLGQFQYAGLDRRTPMVILSLLFGPGIGLFILSPALLIGAFGAGDVWRRDRWYVLGALLAIGACYLFFGCWHNSYTGGVVWGTRYQTHLLPILALPVTIGLRRLTASTSGRRATVAVLTLSIFIQVLSVITTQHMEYFQAGCDPNLQDPFGAPLRNSLQYGQLERRVDNVARWATRRPPALIGDAACQATETLMWDRYMPNFWGPVYAKRLAHGGRAIVAFWFAMLVAAVAMVTVGLRRALRAPDADSR